MKDGGTKTGEKNIYLMYIIYIPSPCNSHLYPSLCTSDWLQGETVLMKRRWRHHCSGHLIELFAHSDLDKGPDLKG